MTLRKSLFGLAGLLMLTFLAGLSASAQANTYTIGFDPMERGCAHMVVLHYKVGDEWVTSRPKKVDANNRPTFQTKNGIIYVSVRYYGGAGILSRPDSFYKLPYATETYLADVNNDVKTFDLEQIPFQKIIIPKNYWGGSYWIPLPCTPRKEVLDGKDDPVPLLVNPGHTLFIANRCSSQVSGIFRVRENGQWVTGYKNVGSRDVRYVAKSQSNDLYFGAVFKKGRTNGSYGPYSIPGASKRYKMLRGDMKTDFTERPNAFIFTADC